MTTEDKAREYAINHVCVNYHCDKRHYISCTNHGMDCEEAQKYYQSYIAGHDSRNTEVAELKAQIKELVSLLCSLVLEIKSLLFLMGENQYQDVCHHPNIDKAIDSVNALLSEVPADSKERAQ